MTTRIYVPRDSGAIAVGVGAAPRFPDAVGAVGAVVGAGVGGGCNLLATTGGVGVAGAGCGALLPNVTGIGPDCVGGTAVPADGAGLLSAVLGGDAGVGSTAGVVETATVGATMGAVSYCCHPYTPATTAIAMPNAIATIVITIRMKTNPTPPLNDHRPNATVRTP